MTKIISYEDLSTTFRYTDDGKLWRKWERGGKWREVDMSKSNGSDGYVKVRFKGELFMAHRIVYSLFHKIDLPADMEIDHANGNKIDNHICNLELVTRSGNQQNQYKHRNGKLVGCYFHKDRQKWIAKIQINGKQKHLGCFPTEIAAHQAYLDAVGWNRHWIDTGSDEIC